MFQDHEFLMATDNDEALERAIRTLRRQIRDLDREDEEFRYNTQSKLNRINLDYTVNTTISGDLKKPYPMS